MKKKLIIKNIDEIKNVIDVENENDKLQNYFKIGHHSISET